MSKAKIPVFYRPEQSSDCSAYFSPSSGKPKLVIKDWKSHPEIADRIRIKSFAPASIKLLSTAHNVDYIKGVLAGRIANGFGDHNRKVAESLRYTVGSIVAATKYVINKNSLTDFRVAVSPTSGFHHAGYSYAGGFCTFNGLMVAAIAAHSLGLQKRILILDMDSHYGNGTDNIIKKLNIDYIDHITATRPFRNNSQALECADLSKNKGIRNRKYSLVLYQAGADIHVQDPLGGILTTSEMILRDELVFSGCAEYNVPIVWNLAGGYQRDSNRGIKPVLDLHRNTMLQCLIQKEK